MALALLIILNCFLIGVLGGNLLYQYTRNKYLESDNVKLRIQNKELTKQVMNNYRQSNNDYALKQDLLKLKRQSILGLYTGKDFCKEVARIIKKHCE